MPKIDSSAPDVQDFSPVPVGEYLAEITDIEASTTNDDDEMWRMKMEIVEGDMAGRFLFDNIVFSKKAMPRAKLICSRFGLDVSKDFNLTEEMLLNRRAYVTVATVEKYEKEPGVFRETSRVGFAGYREVEDKKQQKGEKPKKKF